MTWVRSQHFFIHVAGSPLLRGAILILAACCGTAVAQQKAEPKPQEKKVEPKPQEKKAEPKPQVALSPTDDPAKLKAQLSALQQEVAQLKLKVATLELEKLGASVDIGKGKDGKDIATVNILQKWAGDKDSMQLLKNVPNLQVVYIDSKQVNDAALIPLKDLPSLSALTIMSPQVTDAALENLKSLNELTMLFLTSSKVGDKGLVQLKGLKNLQVLALSRTEVTDSGLDVLRDIKSLRSLYLIGTKVTPQAIDKLKQAMPAVAVYK